VNGTDPVTYTYGSSGFLSKAGDLSLTYGSQSGLLSGTTLGSVTTAQTYSAYGDLATYGAKIGTASVYDASYTHDLLGRITKRVETRNGVATTYDYGYDAADRLATVTKDGAVVESYSYDANGNRITADVNGTVSQGYYDLQDRLTKYGNTTYSYTPSGDLASKTDASGTATYSYDFYGNLTNVVLPDGTSIEYVIDGQNRRVGKKIDGVLTQGWLYQDQLNPIAELDGSGAVIARFVYGDKGNIPSYVVKNGVTYRIVADHLGSPRVVIDTSSNTVVQTYTHDAFGNETTFADPNGLGRIIPFGFAGGIYDEQTGLTRFGARDYDPTIGRWTSKDPILFDGGDTNLYGYVLGDPVNWVDWGGLYSMDDFAINTVNNYQQTFDFFTNGWPKPMTATSMATANAFAKSTGTTSFSMIPNIARTFGLTFALQTFVPNVVGNTLASGAVLSGGAFAGSVFGAVPWFDGRSINENMVDFWWDTFHCENR
jgi:RHS repeat-associated protein